MSRELQPSHFSYLNYCEKNIKGHYLELFEARGIYTNTFQKLTWRVAPKKSAPTLLPGWHRFTLAQRKQGACNFLLYDRGHHSSHTLPRSAVASWQPGPVALSPSNTLCLFVDFLLPRKPIATQSPAVLQNSTSSSHKSIDWLWNGKRLFPC